MAINGVLQGQPLLSAPHIAGQTITETLFIGGYGGIIEYCVFRGIKGAAISTNRVDYSKFDQYVARNWVIRHCTFIDCANPADGGTIEIAGNLTGSLSLYNNVGINDGSPAFLYLDDCAGNVEVDGLTLNVCKQPFRIGGGPNIAISGFMAYAASQLASVDNRGANDGGPGPSCKADLAPPSAAAPLGGKLWAECKALGAPLPVFPLNTAGTIVDSNVQVDWQQGSDKFWAVQRAPAFYDG